VALCEFKANLVNIASSRTARATKETLSQRNKYNNNNSSSSSNNNNNNIETEKSTFSESPCITAMRWRAIEEDSFLFWSPMGTCTCAHTHTHTHTHTRECTHKHILEHTHKSHESEN
jgi:hypothetical protein